MGNDVVGGVALPGVTAAGGYGDAPDGLKCDNLHPRQLAGAAELGGAVCVAKVGDDEGGGWVGLEDVGEVGHGVCLRWGLGCRSVGR